MSKVDTKDLIGKLNKKLGKNTAFNLTEENPTDVKDWISTGSTILDAKINPTSVSFEDVGIPVGRVVELAGLQGVGKSFLAGQIGGNAQKKGYTLVYMDTESSIDSGHLERLGIDVDSMIYVQPESIEHVYSIVEMLLGEGDRFFFIWDSYANTPSEAETKTDNYNPTAGIAVAARINSLAMRKLTIQMARKNSTFLIVNQLKVNITTNHIERMMHPYVTPGGKAFEYAYSLRIWMTNSLSKSNTILDDNNNPIGNLVRVTLEKSRFGSTKRKCEFPIIWGDPENVGVKDEASWFNLFKLAGLFERGGSKGSKLMGPGGEYLYFKGEDDWIKQMQEDPSLRGYILDKMRFELLNSGKDYVHGGEDDEQEQEEIEGGEE